MSHPIFNFSAGPAIVPAEVRPEAQAALVDLGGTGIGILEHSHRSAAFRAVVEDTEATIRRVGGISDDYAVLFLQGGASSQFFMLPANRLPPDATADYWVTGSFAKKAAAEVPLYGNLHVAASSADIDFRALPKEADARYSEAPAYVHFTSNNTIVGTQFQTEPVAPAGSWLACDASSDIFSRPIDFDRYGMVYAGAQKNLGPSGVTLVVMRRDLLEPVRELPSMLRYATHAEDGSLYNTPPTFGIFVLGRVVHWIERQGGLEAMARANREKADVLYGLLDEGGFYAATADKADRSLMNVTFRTPDAERDARFIAQAEARGLSGLKGHRSVGGMRASIYNAFPRAGVEALVDFMREFAASHG